MKKLKKLKDYTICRIQFCLLLITSFFLFTSCSSFLTLFKNEPKYKLRKVNEEQHYCQKKQSINVVHKNKNFVLNFESILKKSKKYNLNFNEQAVLWSLFQLVFSPSDTTTNARFQVVLGNKDQLKIFDFNKKDPRLKLDETYLEGLKILLKEIKSNKSLTKMLNIAQEIFPDDVEVDFNLADYINTNQSNLMRNSSTKKSFFKAKSPLQPGETFRRIHFNKLKNKIKVTKKLTSIQAPLFNLNLDKNSSHSSEIKCNMDLNLYGKSIFLIDKKSLKSNVFSIYSDDGSFFVGISTISPNWDSKNLGYLVKSEEISKPQPICILKNQENKKTIIISFNDRDPGQHIYHLLQYGLASASNDEEFFEFIKYPRHQFLLNPPRLIYESKRGSSKQLQSLLKLNFPVYNASELAEIWILNQNNNQSSLITDDRSKTYQSCQKK